MRFCWKSLVTAVALFGLPLVHAAPVDADFTTAGVLGGDGTYTVGVAGVGDLFLSYEDNGGRNRYNGVEAAGVPTPHFGLGANAVLSIGTSANFGRSALTFTFWDLDTVRAETETVTLDNAFSEAVTLTGADSNIVNMNSNRIGVQTLTVALRGSPITLTAGDFGTSAFVLAGISAVPLPAAAWLFGTSLLGFIALSNRKRAAVA